MPSSGTSRGAPLVALLSICAVAALLLVAKIQAFDSLDYSSDLFTFLQASRSPFTDRPLLHASPFGLTVAFHNVYCLLVFAPLVSFFGAAGLFAGHALILVLASREFFLIANGSCLRASAAVLIFFAGPVAFWLWHHPGYGWHPELLFFPLSVLFAGSLIRTSKSALFWGIFLVFTHEAGPLVAGATHVYVATAWPAAYSFESSFGRLGIKQTAWVRVAIFWSVVFVLGLLLLRLVQALSGNTAQASRLSAAMMHLWNAGNDREVLHGLDRMSTTSLRLLLSGAVFFLVGLRPRRAWVLLLGSIPLLAVFAMSGLAYFDGSSGSMMGHGMTWPPRFAALWGLLVVAALVSLHLDQNDKAGTWPGWTRVVPVLALAIFVQQFQLRRIRGYPILENLQILSPWYRGLEGRLSAREDGFLRCLAARLPTETSIVAHGSFFARFQHQGVVWPRNLDVAVQPPGLFVCDLKDRLPHEIGCLDAAADAIAAGMTRYELEALQVVASEPWESAVISCATQLEQRAGHNAL